MIDRLDARHDELIQKLDELNAQIEKALAKIFQSRAATTRGPAPAAAPADSVPRRAA
jgi:hypothetical protein